MGRTKRTREALKLHRQIAEAKPFVGRQFRLTDQAFDPSQAKLDRFAEVRR